MKIIGFPILLVGLTFVIFFFMKFFSNIGGDDFQDFLKYLWMVFTGFPLAAMGGVLLMYAYMGAMQRYIVEKTAPTAVKTANYVLAETKDNIKEIAQTVGSGNGGKKRVCPNCNVVN